MTSLFDDVLGGVLDAVWLTRCVGCEKPGELLCEECAEALPFIEPRWACPRCGAPFGWLACSECMTVDGPEELSYVAAVSALEHCDTSQRMILAYKDRDERRLAGILAGILFHALPRGWLAWADALCWIPDDPDARKRRGFDHMAQIAEVLAEQSGREAVGLLQKRRVADQRGLSRQERAANIQASFEVDQQARDSLMVRMMDTGRAPRLILIDDVLTTGATVKAATAMLKEAGIEEVRIATIARVW